MTPPGSLV